MRCKDKLLVHATQRLVLYGGVRGAGYGTASSYPKGHSINEPEFKPKLLYVFVTIPQPYS